MNTGKNSTLEAIKRKKCIMCEGSLSSLYTLPKFPIYMGTIEQETEKDIYADMSFMHCGDCGCVQLGDLVPLEILYANAHNSVVGKTWEEHHRQFCEFVRAYAKGFMVEIGGGNLVVAKRLATEESVEKITVYDNNVLKYGTCDSPKIELREAFFNPHDIEDPIDVIIHTHLIEHLYNPLEEIREMSHLLEDGSYMMFGSPLIDKMLADKFTNAFNFEHSYLLSRPMIENIMKYSQLEIIDEKRFSPYALFIVARKNTSINREVAHDYTEDVNVFTKFVSYHEEEVKRIKSLLDTEKERTFIFGAHIFTQYLLGFGLEERSFSNILDNDPNKIGSRLYGTNLTVRSPKILQDIESPLVVLKAAQYTEEIKTDILTNINPNTRFIL